MQTTGDKVIARPFRRAFNKDGSFHIDKVPVIQIFPYVMDHLMSNSKVVQHARAAQVKVTIAEPKLLINITILIYVKYRSFRFVEYIGLLDQDLYPTSHKVGVSQPFRPGPDKTLDLNHVFAPQLPGQMMRFLGFGGIKDHLSQPVTIAQVNKDQSAVVASPVNPPGQGHLLSRVIKS